MVEVSATNRGDARHPDDFYATPEWCTRAVLPELAPFHTMIEPGCGNGAIARVVKQFHPDARIFGVDVNEDRLSQARPYLVTGWSRHGSFLDWYPWSERFDIAIGNPPYDLAMDFIRHALTMTNRVCFLLRVNFLASKERASFHRTHPSHLHILPKRPSFARSVKCEKNSRKGGSKCDFQVLLSLEEEWPRLCPKCASKTVASTSDATEYAWFEWGPHIKTGGWSILEEPKAAA